ncbi:ATP-grasp domain-containing protein [Candidatus Dependentiae bacterium]|nr:ATP-grasp domain-containing protein [Candidatus Dependentiae bacterium]
MNRCDGSSSKIRIGVLMGGKSVEREVSFNSGRTICDHIDTDRYEVIPIFQTACNKLFILPLKFLHRGKISDFEHRLYDEAEEIVWDDLRDTVDFIYIAVHGRFAEDGTLQGMLEVFGVPYLGSKLFASACGIDKIFQKKLLLDHGIFVANDISLTPNQVKLCDTQKLHDELIQAGILFPCIVKPALEGSSLGISVVNSPGDLVPALRKASHEGVTAEQSVLIEEKIDGMEFTCIGIQGDDNTWQTFPLTEVVPEGEARFYDYEQKYMPGRANKITPARCSRQMSEKIQDICICAGEALDFSTFFRIDGFLKHDGSVVIIDPNTLSGMGPASFLFHQAAEVGMNHTELINHLIDVELKKYGLVGKQNIMDTKKKRAKKTVVVLFGGSSNEREISLESGRNVCYKLSPSKYNVIPVFVDLNMKLYKLSSRLLLQNSTREIAERLEDDSQILWADLPKVCDFVFIALHGGEGENGSVQGTLEMLDLPYNGPGVLASALCMDKYKTNQFLQKRGFSVPKSRLVIKEGFEKQCEIIEAEFGIPLIVKPHDDGCSMYVKKVDEKSDLKKVLKEFFETEKAVALVEECVAGMELTCGVVGNEEVRVFPPSLAVAAGGILSIEEKFLPGAGENQTPAPLPPEALQLVQKTIEGVYREVGCRGYSRIDCFYQDETISPDKKPRVVVLEVNTLPGLTPATCLFHQAAEIGMKPMELLDTIVALGLGLVT